MTHDQRNAHDLLVDAVFAPLPAPAEVVAVVAGEDDDGVFTLAGGVEGGEDPTDLGVDEADACEVAAAEVAPLVALAEPGEAGFRERPMEIPGET